MAMPSPIRRVHRGDRGPRLRDRCFLQHRRKSPAADPATSTTSSAIRLTSSGRHAASGLPRAAETTSTANYSRMGEFGGGGDFVVLRASGTDEYNDYIFGLCRCDSVETIVFDEGRGDCRPVRDRNDPERRGRVDCRRRPVELHPLLEGHAGRGRDQFRRGEACAGWRHERRHGRPRRIRLLGGRQGKPDERGRPRRSLCAGPDARARFPVAAAASRTS